MEAITLLVLFLVVSLVFFLLKVTYAVTVADPKFALKAFALGLVSSAVGYLAEGHVTIEIVLWGVSGFVLYAVFKYAFDRA